MFPAIERLGPGSKLELYFRVEATKPGHATFRISLLHDGLEKSHPIEAMEAFTVTQARRP